MSDHDSIPILRQNPCELARLASLAARRAAAPAVVTPVEALGKTPEEAGAMRGKVAPIGATSKSADSTAVDPTQAAAVPVEAPQAAVVTPMEKTTLIGSKLPSEAGPAQVILDALILLCDPAGVHEIRMLHTKRGTISGYYDAEHRQKMASLAASCSGKVEAVYITLNPCRPECGLRAMNRYVEYARHTTEDSEVTKRRWLPLDFDPVRPAGISSTDEEHEAALLRARDAREWIREKLGVLGLLADSGNGAHVLIRVDDWPNNKSSTEKVRKIIERVSKKFSDSAVQVDRTVYNAARIWKMYGTWVHKGDEGFGRVWRMARILETSNERLA